MAISYRADIDGLRAVAVLSVVLFHTFPDLVTGGFVGVDIFFVISGYLITGILAREAAGSAGILDFYRRRIRRIFPALILVLLVSLVSGWVLFFADDFIQLARQVVSGAAFFANFYYLGRVGYFDGAAEEKHLLHLWSLGVEEQFYIVWPFLIWGCLRLRLRAVGLVAALSAISFTASLFLTWSDPAYAFYSPLTRLWQLGAGGVLALSRIDTRAAAVRDSLSFLGLGLIAVSLVLIRDNATFPGFWAVAPVAGAAMVIAAGPHAAGNKLLSLKPAVWLGLISYPLYLWHWPLLTFAIAENNLQRPVAYQRAALMALAALLAWATYRLIEKPLRRCNAAALVAAMTIVLVAASAIIAADGVPMRRVNKDLRKRFVAHYAELHRNGLRDAYREECDFVFNRSRVSVKHAIPASCTAAGERGTIFLWGDSHAQALSLGLRRALPEGYALAQVASQGCRPSLTPRERPGIASFNRAARACARSNAYALESIARLRPEVVIVAQRAGHEEEDWEVLAVEVRRRGAGRLVLVGPLPQWLPSLPRIVVEHHWPLHETYIATGLAPGILETDRILRHRYAASSSLQFVSLIAALCRADGCRARVGNTLMAVDYGHLSAEGSIYVGRHLIATIMSRTAPEGR